MDGRKTFEIAADMKDLPRYAQTQRALNDQLRDLGNVANRLGLYDARDFIQRKLEAQEKRR